jgi:hypothetical protein
MNITDLSTRYWLDTQSNKTLATTTITVYHNGTVYTHEYTCPTPVEEWEQIPDSLYPKKYRTPTPPTNKPVDRA